MAGSGHSQQQGGDHYDNIPESWGETSRRNWPTQPPVAHGRAPFHNNTQDYNTHSFQQDSYAYQRPPHAQFTPHGRMIPHRQPLPAEQHQISTQYLSSSRHNSIGEPGQYQHTQSQHQVTRSRQELNLHDPSTFSEASRASTQPVKSERNKLTKQPPKAKKEVDGGAPSVHQGLSYTSRSDQGPRSTAPRRKVHSNSGDAGTDYTAGGRKVHANSGETGAGHTTSFDRDFYQEEGVLGNSSASYSTAGLLPSGESSREDASTIDLEKGREASRTRDTLGRDRHGRTRQENTHKGRWFSVTITIPTGSLVTAQKWFKDPVQREEDMIHELHTFLSPADGHLTCLVVQAVDRVYDGPQNCTWRRDYVRNIAPTTVRLSNWTIDLLNDTRGWTWKDWTLLVGKWTVSCFGLCCVAPFSPFGFPSVRNNGGYDPIRYRDWEYIDSPRNNKERKPGAINKMEQNQARFKAIEASELARHEARAAHVEHGTLSAWEVEQHLNPAMNRTLRPTKLCILKTSKNAKGTNELVGFDIVDVAEYMKRCGETTHPDYMFVAYTERQFDTSATDKKDKAALFALAEQATRDAGLIAFWIAPCCFPPANEDDIVEELWRASDIIRGATRLAIIVGPSIDARGPKAKPDPRDMLLEFGSRMWTLPEVLLSPRGAPVSIYVRDTDTFDECEKNNLAVRVWGDAHVTRQLMDHFEGTVILSPLELIVIALQCLTERSVDALEINQLTDDSNQIRGEMSYVLMGLMLQRPVVDLKDSAFQAFARLALANYSHMLLERMVCVMPTRQHQPWHDTTDYWDVQLYDIYPFCQVAGICSGDTINIDGAYGAMIKWDKFERVAHVTQQSFKRMATQILLRLSPVILITGLAMVAFTKGQVGQMVAGIMCLIVALLVLGSSPYLVRLLFTGKLWDTQAHFFAFEGYMDIATLETHIFGASMKRLMWTPFASTLSSSKPGKHGECVGQDPTLDPDTLRLIEQIYKAGPESKGKGQLRVFTLVDTFTMSVTLFLAENPPVSVMICGTEGGMQRALLCSYDSVTNTFRRETVLRMETQVLNRMQRVPRFKFQFERPTYESQEGVGPFGMVGSMQGAGGARDAVIELRNLVL